MMPYSASAYAYTIYTGHVERATRATEHAVYDGGVRREPAGSRLRRLRSLLAFRRTEHAAETAVPTA